MKPPIINKDDILNSLTDHESDNEDWTTVDPIETSPKVNGIGTLTNGEQHDGMKMYG